jgi:hypothetical protein
MAKDTKIKEEKQQETDNNLTNWPYIDSSATVIVFPAKIY